MEFREWLRNNILLTVTLCLLVLVACGELVYLCYGAYLLVADSQYYTAVFSISSDYAGWWLLLISVITFCALGGGFGCLILRVDRLVTLLTVFLWILAVVHFAVWFESQSASVYIVEWKDWGIANPTDDPFTARNGLSILGREFDERFQKEFELAARESQWERPVSEMFDTLQEKLECCGSNGVQDYADLNLSLPLSCCPHPDRVGECEPEEAFLLGCKPIYIDFMHQTRRTIGVLAVINWFITIIAATSTRILGFYNRNHPEERVTLRELLARSRDQS